MGFTNPEISTLMGAHSVGKMDSHCNYMPRLTLSFEGKMEPLNSGYAGKWDNTFALLDNTYYSQIVNRPWVRFTVDETTVS